MLAGPRAKQLPIIAIALVGCLIALQSRALAVDVATEETPCGQMLILRNGEVLEGRIVRDEGGYVVNLADGQIRVKEGDVELVCRNLDDGYHRKRATIQPGNVHHHLELAQWCLRHGLLGFAAVELADATSVDPQHPMIRVLQHRLKMAVEPPAPTETKNATRQGPTNEELDRMVRGLPRGTVEIYTQSVQPILMNHCTGSGCHGYPSQSGLSLMRVSIGRSSSKRFTQRNLYSILQYVDRENPLQSKLLTATNRPHGSVEHAIFTEREAMQFKRLVDWVNQLGRNEGMEGSPAMEAAPMAADPFGADAAPRVLSEEARQARPLDASGRNRQTTPAPKAGDSGKLSTTPSSPAPSQPTDPFDPTIFNRQKQKAGQEEIKR